MDFKIVLWVAVIQILLEFLKAHNISLLVHAISVLVFNLKTIICQVHVLVVLVHFSSVFLTACSQVTLVVKVKLIIAVCESPHSNVKLAIFEKERPLYVLLDDPVREL